MTCPSCAGLASCTCASKALPSGNNEAEHVTLSVGGSLFETTLSTLLNVPGSMFFIWFSPREDEHALRLFAPDARGVHRIDRCPRAFPYVLDYLRASGSAEDTVLPGLGTPDVTTLLRLLAREADFYLLPGLAAAVRAHAASPLSGSMRFAADDGLMLLSASGTRLETTRATLARAPRLCASLERAPQSLEADAAGALRVVYHLDEDATLVNVILRVLRYGAQGAGRGSWVVTPFATKDKQMATACASLAEKWGVDASENLFGERA